MCISIIVTHSGSGSNAIIAFSATDGERTVTGDRAWGWGGMGTPTDAEYKLSVTPYVLSWFGATESDLCGYVPPSTGTNSVVIVVAAIIIYYYFMRGK